MTFKIKPATDRRSTAMRATLAGVDKTWADWRDVAARVTVYSRETVKNNLQMLAEEGAIDTRYGERGRSEYRLPEASDG